MRKPLATLICTWFGAGLSPKAPGTMGTLAALPFAVAIHQYAGAGGLLLAAALAFFIGWTASNIYMGADRNRDPQEIVVDEVAGVWLLLATLPHTALGYALGFVLFRAFDIVKPWPVSWADKHIKGGLGVMLDDILAALYPIPFIAMYYAL